MTNIKSRLPRTVVLLGLVSFLNDLASDMVIPLIPLVLSGSLAAGPIALGLIEGVADAVASLLKLWSGRHSDYLGGKRKGLTAAGYVLSNLSRPWIGAVAAWPMLLLLRSIDRVGKGIRSAPRDAMLADATPLEMRGYAYGFHRMLDNAGALAGALLAAAVIAFAHLSLTQVILFSAIPGGLTILLIMAVPEAVHKSTSKEPLPPLAWLILPPTTRRYLSILLLFTFAKASETFIVLRGNEMGLSTVQLLLLWAALNLAKAMTSSVGGIAADRLGRRQVMMASWAAFGIAFCVLGQVISAQGLWAATIAYGLAEGLSEGTERALIADLAPPTRRGTAFGWYYLVTGIAAIPAGIAFGALWQWSDAAVAFGTAGFLAIASALLLSQIKLSSSDAMR